MTIGHYQGLYEHSGVGSYIRRIVSAQRREGHRVIYFDLPEGFPDDVGNDDIDEAVRVENNQELYAEARRRKVDVLHAHHLLTDPPPDGLPVIRSVHNHRPYCPSRYRYLRRRGRPCPRSFTVMGCLWGMAVDGCGARNPRRWMGDFAATRYEEAVLPRVPCLTISRFVKDEMVRNGYPEENIAVLYYPAPSVEKVSAPPSQGIPRLLFMGRIEHPKGLAVVLEALARVTSPVKLDVAGDGPLRRAMEQRVERLGLADRVHFHGWVERSALEELLRRSRALVMPSQAHETFGLAALEALSMARPVVVSRVGALPEFVEDGKTGFLLPHDGVEAWAGAIERLAGDLAMARAMGEEARALVEKRYTLSDHLARLHMHYNKVINMWRSAAV